jgi:hypothetical protein
VTPASAETTEVASSVPIPSVVKISAALIAESAARRRPDAHRQPYEVIVHKQDHACETSARGSAARCEYSHGFADMIRKVQKIIPDTCLALTHLFFISFTGIYTDMGILF